MTMPTAGKAPKGYSSFSTMAPQQQQLFQQLLSGMFGGGQNPLFGAGQNYLQQLLGGGPEATAAFEAPYLRQFQEQTVPGLAERFAGLGSGAQSSSAFQQALGQAGAGLSENLASLRSGLQMQALPQALQYSQQPFNQARSLLDVSSLGFAPKQTPWWQSLLAGLGGGVGQGIGMGATGGIGSIFGKLFGGR